MAVLMQHFTKKVNENYEFLYDRGELGIFTGFGKNRIVEKIEKLGLCIEFTFTEIYTTYVKFSIEALSNKNVFIVITVNMGFIDKENDKERTFGRLFKNNRHIRFYTYSKNRTEKYQLRIYGLNSVCSVDRRFLCVRSFIHDETKRDSLYKYLQSIISTIKKGYSIYINQI